VLPIFHFLTSTHSLSASPVAIQNILSKKIPKKCKVCQKRDLEEALFKPVAYKGVGRGDPSVPNQLCIDCWSREVENEETGSNYSRANYAWLKIRALNLSSVVNFINQDIADIEIESLAVQTMTKRQTPRAEKQVMYWPRILCSLLN